MGKSNRIPDYEIFIFSYDDGDLLKNIIQKSLSSNTRRITLIGGGKIPYDFIQGIKDQRFRYIRQPERIGKPKTVKLAIEMAAYDIIIMSSGDITIEDGTLDKIALSFEDQIGAVICKIEPINLKSFFSKLSSVLWEVHDKQVEFALRSGLPAHAGELLGIRKKCLAGYNEEINDDAYFCINAVRMGLKIKYIRDVIIKCVPPRNLNDFVKQRRRIDYGHIQLRNEGLEPYVVSILSKNTIRYSFLISLEAIKKNFRMLPYFMILIFMELFISTASRIDTALNREYLIWDLISRD